MGSFEVSRRGKRPAPEEPGNRTPRTLSKGCGGDETEGGLFFLLQILLAG
jgi:hypothetical protein